MYRFTPLWVNRQAAGASWASGLAARVGALAVSLGCMVLGGCDARGARAQISLQSCRAAGIWAKCVTIQTPEDPRAPEGRQVPLDAVILPAVSGAALEDPVLFLAGGPGQAATQLAGFVATVLGNLRYRRDLVFVDQRGSASSHGLGCDLRTSGDLAERFQPGFPLERIARCLERFEGDPGAYTTAASVRDLESVRLVLGYERLNLVGVSYGTRLALAYAEAFPERVRTLTLDGVAPPALRLFWDFVPDAQRALDQMFARCAAEPACAAAFPALKSRFVAWLQKLKTAPESVTVSDPRTGEPASFSLTRDAVASNVRGLLYSRELLPLVPYALAEAISGRLGPLVAAVELMASAAEDNMSVGLLLSVVCAEDVPYFAGEDVAKLGTENFLAESGVDDIRSACKIWSVPPVNPRGERTQLSIPAVLLSGENDPATPPRWSALAARELPNSVQWTVPGGSHGTLSLHCVQQLVQRFIETADPKQVDSRCLENQTPPRFFVNALGAAPGGEAR